MSIEQFGKQKTKSYPPTIRFDGTSGKLLWKSFNVEQDIGDRQIGLVLSTFKWGWAAYVAGVGKVLSDMQSVSDGDMAAQPKLPAGKTKKGEPASWFAFAAIDALVEGSQTRCVFEITDIVCLSAIQALCDANVGKKGVAIRFTGCEVTGTDDDFVRIPQFHVVE